MTKDEQKDFFNENGYLIIPGYLPPERIERLLIEVENIFSHEGVLSGWEQPANAPFVRRLSNLFSKGDVFVDLATEPIILEYAEMVIGNLFSWHGMNLHDPLPGYSLVRQAIHADRENFKNCTAYFNVLCSLDDITSENGATRIVPKSHKRAWPKELLEDLFAPVKNEVLAICPAGSLVFIHGDVWHGARMNNSLKSRRVIHIGYANPETPTQYPIANTLPEAVHQRIAKLSNKLVLR